LPYAVVESVAMGATSIASRIGGAPEILEALRPRYSPFKPNLLVRLSKK
jgi:hypothetical protein